MLYPQVEVFNFFSFQTKHGMKIVLYLIAALFGPFFIYCLWSSFFFHCLSHQCDVWIMECVYGFEFDTWCVCIVRTEFLIVSHYCANHRLFLFGSFFFTSSGFMMTWNLHWLVSTSYTRKSLNTLFWILHIWLKKENIDWVFVLLNFHYYPNSRCHILNGPTISCVAIEN